MNFGISVQKFTTPVLGFRRLDGTASWIQRHPQRDLKLDVDAAFEEAGVLDHLGVFRTKGLLEDISSIQNRLDFSRQ